MRWTNSHTLNWSHCSVGLPDQCSGNQSCSITNFPVILSKENLTMSLVPIRCQIPMEITGIGILWGLVRSPHYTQVSFLHIQTNLDTGMSLILSKLMTTLLPPNLSYLAAFSVSEGGNKAQNIAQDPSSTQTHFSLFISLIDCIRELQHKAHHIQDTSAFSFLIPLHDLQCISLIQRQNNIS